MTDTPRTEVTTDLVAVGEAMWAFASAGSEQLRSATDYVATAAGAESNLAIGTASLGVATGWICLLYTSDACLLYTSPSPRDRS